LLAGFGVQTLFESENVREIFQRPLRVLGWMVAGVAAILTIPAFTGKEASEWGYMAFLQILFAFCLLLAVIRHGWRGRGARFLLVALTLCDLSVMNFTLIRNTKTIKEDENSLQTLFDTEALANFFKSQRGLFRVHFEADWLPSIGEVYGVFSTGGMAATSMQDYSLFMFTVPHSLDMLGVRYLVRSAGDTRPGFVYADKHWKVYPAVTPYFPRAWMVGKVFVERDRLKAYARMQADDFDARQMAVSADALDVPASTPEAIPAAISWVKFEDNRMEMKVGAPSPGLLVVAEMYYPGWHALVDGREVPLHKVNNVFRGVALPKGESRVVLVYRPRSVYAGGAITLLCFAGVIVWFLASRPREAT
jgi:hypothetical protein